MMTPSPAICRQSAKPKSFQRFRQENNVASLNRVDIIGNLGADPETRRLNDGSPVVNLRVACTDTWRDKNTGDRKERTEWVSVVIFNDGLAKVAEQYLRKGSKVFISGSMQTRKWEKDGVDRY